MPHLSVWPLFQIGIFKIADIDQIIAVVLSHSNLFSFGSLIERPPSKNHLVGRLDRERILVRWVAKDLPTPEWTHLNPPICMHVFVTES